MMAEIGDSNCASTEAEKKIRNAKRERSNRISSIMGQYLLKSYTMLNETCESCDTILLRNRQGEYHCVGCIDIDNDTSKDDPAVNTQAAISHLQEQSCSKVHVVINESESSTIADFDNVEKILRTKLLSTSNLLIQSMDVELSIKLTKLIQILSETINTIMKMKG